MFEVMIEDSFSAAHRLLNYNGVCENQHGHNWKVQVFVLGGHLDDSGILIDFGILKQHLHDVLSELDHEDLNELKAFKNESPSSELIARHIYRSLKEKIKGISKVSVWETEDAKATYWE